MKLTRIILLLAIAMVASGCGLFGGDDGTELSSSDAFTPEPTANVVDIAPADEADTATEAEAAAPLPTAVTIPPTPVPPEPTPDRSQPMTYVVQSGDVLGLIAERFDVPIADLRRVNGLSGNLIRVGQSLTIPPLEGLADETASGDTGAEGDEVAGDAAAPTAVPEPTSAPAPVSCGSNAVGHCVQSGDTLLGIALQYGISVDDLRSANPSISGDTIKVGDLLNLPGSSGGDTTGGDTTGGDSSGGDTAGGDSVVTDPTTVDIPPRSNEDCAARNREYPYYHAGDGLCYANPIGSGTPVPTSPNAEPDVECPEGRILWDDGLCYPDPNYTPEPTATVEAKVISPDYGTAPCETPYFVANETGICLLTQEGVDAGYGGAGTPEPTASS